MAGVPIKFRCYKCNQLLGVSRSKIGTAITCPRCATGLIVPNPDEPAATVGPRLPAETTPAFLAALSAGMPVEIADIRPEDIRADADLDDSPPIELDAAPSLLGAAPARFPQAAPLDLIDLAPAEPPASRPASRPEPIPVPLPSSPLPPAAVEPLVTAIKVDPPALVLERPASGRSRDLVLPRSVVAFWSLFVLLAQALAFLAGLLAGHFIWRVH